MHFATADPAHADTGRTHWAQASCDGLRKPKPHQSNELDESASRQMVASPYMEDGRRGRAAYHDAVTGAYTSHRPMLDAVCNGWLTRGHRIGDDKNVAGERGR
jgi:hypothetical protein